MPEMSAPEIRNNILSEINIEKPDFICLNFANPDMVGHTGVFNSIVSAVETVDSCLHAIVEAGKKQGYEFIVIADHGNADYAINQDEFPNTAHSLNPVPIVFVSEKPVKLKNGILADIAPTILNLFNIKTPKEMSGKTLLSLIKPVFKLHFNKLSKKISLYLKQLKKHDDLFKKNRILLFYCLYF